MNARSGFYVIMEEIICHCEPERSEWRSNLLVNYEIALGYRPRNDIWLSIIPIPFDLASFQSIRQLGDIGFCNII